MKVKVISLPYIFQVLCFTRQRYQVSVCRTIGPLVIISSPEPSGSQGELIVYHAPASIRRPSVVRHPFTISNIFSSEAAWPIKAKFYVEPPLEERTKVCINDPGHMTKMAAMPIYGKNLKTFSFPKPEVL